MLINVTQDPYGTITSETGIFKPSEILFDITYTVSIMDWTLG